uniref:Anoctamin n=1 Tax=Macrostomum lignano TaxID=282301 RepID=A0A1I8IXZ9_9PLAT
CIIFSQGGIRVGSLTDHCELGGTRVDCFSQLNLLTTYYIVFRSALKSFIDYLWPLVKHCHPFWSALRCFKSLLACFCPCLKSQLYGVELSCLNEQEMRLKEPGARRHGGNADDQQLEEFLEFACQRHMANEGDDVEYLDKMILYGYMVLFGSACFLAPVAALVALTVDLRLDASRLLLRYRRPLPRPSQGLGIWGGILDCLSYAGVFSTAAILAFTSDSLSVFVRLQDLSEDRRVLYRLVLFIAFVSATLSLKFLLIVAIRGPSTKLKMQLKWEYWAVPKILAYERVSDDVVKKLEKIRSANEWFRSSLPCCPGARGSGRKPTFVCFTAFHQEMSLDFAAGSEGKSTQKHSQALHARLAASGSDCYPSRLGDIPGRKRFLHHRPFRRAGSSSPAAAPAQPLPVQPQQLSPELVIHQRVQEKVQRGVQVEKSVQRRVRNEPEVDEQHGQHAGVEQQAGSEQHQGEPPGKPEATGGRCVWLAVSVARQRFGRVGQRTQSPGRLLPASRPSPLLDRHEGEQPDVQGQYCQQRGGSEDPVQAQQVGFHPQLHAAAVLTEVVRQRGRRLERQKGARATRQRHQRCAQSEAGLAGTHDAQNEDPGLHGEGGVARGQNQRAQPVVDRPDLQLARGGLLLLAGQVVGEHSVAVRGQHHPADEQVHARQHDHQEPEAALPADGANKDHDHVTVAQQAEQAQRRKSSDPTATRRVSGSECSVHMEFVALPMPEQDLGASQQQVALRAEKPAFISCLQQNSKAIGCCGKTLIPTLGQPCEQLRRQALALIAAALIPAACPRGNRIGPFPPCRSSLPLINPMSHFRISVLAS